MKAYDEVASNIYYVMIKLQRKPTIKDDLEGVYKKNRDISKENITINVN